MTKRASLVPVVIGIAVGFPILLCGCAKPPSNQQLIRHFEENRAAFDRLREIAAGDINVRDVAPFGVQMVDSPIHVTPPTPLFSTAKYQEYMHLLKAAGGTRISRSEGQRPAICINVYAEGWAGDARHKDICWRESPLAKGSRFADSLIERNWYLEED
jgi:hypothetical protein